MTLMYSLEVSERFIGYCDTRIAAQPKLQLSSTSQSIPYRCYRIFLSHPAILSRAFTEAISRTPRLQSSHSFKAFVKFKAPQRSFQEPLESSDVTMEHNAMAEGRKIMVWQSPSSKFISTLPSIFRLVF